MKALKHAFIPLLGITQSGDTMLSVILVWTALKAASGTTALGIVLAITSFLPYALQLVFPKIKGLIGQAPEKCFAYARALGLIIAISGLLMPLPLSPAALYTIAGSFALVNFFSQQCLEVSMSNMVLTKRISSSEGSRVLQSGIQLGAFVGGAMGGVLLDAAGLRGVFAYLCGTLLFGFFIPAVLKALGNGKPETHAQQDVSAGKGQVPPLNTFDVSNRAILRSAILCIGLATVQLGAFNYLIPIEFMHGKHWQASSFGIVLGAAGVGALVATFPLIASRFQKTLVAIAALGIAISDVMLWRTANVFVAASATFILGYCLNTVRIAQRERIFASINSPIEGATWAGHVTVVTQVTRSFMPLLLAFVMRGVGGDSAGELLGAIGLAVGCGITLLHLSQTYKTGIHVNRVGRA